MKKLSTFYGEKGTKKTIQSSSFRSIFSQKDKEFHLKIK
jgi:hypothetical protein